MRVRGVLLLLCMAALSGCAGAQFKLPQVTEAEISQASLAVAGKTDSLDVHERSDGESREMVEHVTKRLRRVAPEVCQHAETSCFFNVVYVDDDFPNALALEGGRIEVYRGLLQYLESEDELAAVIGHEMGHHIAEHLQEKQQNAAIGAVIAGILTAGAIAATGGNSYNPYQAQDTINQSMRLGASIGAISFSKEQEREADLVGAYLLERAGYNLFRAGRLYEVISAMDDKTRSSWLDTHPAGPERVAAWQKAIIEVRQSEDLLPDQ